MEKKTHQPLLCEWNKHQYLACEWINTSVVCDWKKKTHQSLVCEYKKNQSLMCEWKKTRLWCVNEKKPNYSLVCEWKITILWCVNKKQKKKKKTAVCGVWMKKKTAACVCKRRSSRITLYPAGSERQIASPLEMCSIDLCQTGLQANRFNLVHTSYSWPTLSLDK